MAEVMTTIAGFILGAVFAAIPAMILFRTTVGQIPVDPFLGIMTFGSICGVAAVQRLCWISGIRDGMFRYRSIVLAPGVVWFLLVVAISGLDQMVYRSAGVVLAVLLTSALYAVAVRMSQSKG